MAAVARFSRLVTSALLRSRSGGQVRAISVLAEVADLHLPRDDNFCYILGKNGPLKLSSTNIISIHDYLEEVSLLDRAPNNRLIEDIDEEFPYLIQDRIRRLIRTGLLPLYFSKKCGVLIPDSDYTEDNLAVLPGLDLLVFRSLNLSHTVSELGNCYGPFLKLFKSLACKYTNPRAMMQLPKGMDLLVKYLELPVVKDHMVIYDPSLFSKVLTATMYCEVHRILREQCPARDMGVKANDIMQKIDEKIYSFMRSCSKNALLISYSGAHGEKAGLSSHSIVSSKVEEDESETQEVDEDGKVLDPPLKLRNLMGNKDLSVDGKRITSEGNVELIPGDELTSTLLNSAKTVQPNAASYEQIRSARKKVMSHVKQLRTCQIRLLKLLQEKGMHKDLEIDLEGPKSASVKLKAMHASAIVDTHRHGVAHAVQTDNFFLVDHLPEQNQKSLKKEKYDVNDVVDLFQYKCSEYLSVAVFEFDEQEIWYLLNLPTRFPVPDIYNL